MKNKKFLLGMFIFLLTIGISSFSWATQTNYGPYTYDSTNTNVLDSSNYQTYLDTAYSYAQDNNIDITDYHFAVVGGKIYASGNYQGVSVLFFKENNYWESGGAGAYAINNAAFGFGAPYVDSVSSPFYYVQFYHDYTNVYLYVFQDQAGYNKPLMYLDSSYNYACDVDIFDGSNNVILDSSNVTLVNPTIDDVGGGESGGESEDDGSILDFLSNFWNNLIHIVVPTSEQWEEIQENFEDEVLGKFNIPTLTFDNNDLDYEMDGHRFQNDKAPYIEFSFLGADCTFDLQQINDFLDTPFNFGKKKIWVYGSANQGTMTLDNGGLTLRTLLNLFIAIDITFVNLALYNRFLNKGDD